MVSLFGDADKPVLNAAIGIGAVLIAAALGVAARRNWTIGVVGFMVAGGVGLVAALRQPLTSQVLAVVTVVAAIGAALVVLRMLLATTAPPGAGPGRGRPAGARPPADLRGSHARLGPPELPAPRRWCRRGRGRGRRGRAEPPRRPGGRAAGGRRAAALDGRRTVAAGRQLAAGRGHHAHRHAHRGVLSHRYRAGRAPRGRGDLDADRHGHGRHARSR